MKIKRSIHKEELERKTVGIYVSKEKRGEVAIWITGKGWQSMAVLSAEQA